MVWAVVAASLAPCAARAASPFEGVWNGAWSEAASGEGGNATLTINDSGAVHGRVVNTATGQTGPIWGAVSPDGRLDLHYFYNNDTTSFAAVGSAVRQGDALSGKVTFRTASNEVIGQGTFQLTAASPAGGGRPPQFVPSAGKPEAAPMPAASLPAASLPAASLPAASQPAPARPTPARPTATIFGVPVAPVIPVTPSAPAATGVDAPGAVAEPRQKDFK